MKYYNQLRRSESGRGGLHQGKARLLVILWQVAIPENREANFIQMEQVTFKKIYVYPCTHGIINENRGL